MSIRFPAARVVLTQGEGVGFLVLARARAQLRKAGATGDEIKECMRECSAATDLTAVRKILDRWLVVEEHRA